MTSYDVYKKGIYLFLWRITFNKKVYPKKQFHYTIDKAEFTPIIRTDIYLKHS